MVVDIDSCILMNVDLCNGLNDLIEANKDMSDSACRLLSELLDGVTAYHERLNIAFQGFNLLIAFYSVHILQRPSVQLKYKNNIRNGFAPKNEDEEENKDEVLETTSAIRLRCLVKSLENSRNNVIKMRENTLNIIMILESAQ